MPTRNAQDTAAMIKRIAIREQNGERTPIQIRTDKKPVSLLEQQLFIVESLPNIGPVNAKNLLQHFGSVSEIFNASESELQEVEGIGKKTAKNIRKAFEFVSKKASKSEKPVILFLDEMDSILSKRMSDKTEGSKEDNKSVNTLLTLITNAKDNNVIIFYYVNYNNVCMVQK